MIKLLKFKHNKGFTLIELMVTIGIFVLMTGALLARYGKFNHGIILTNLAYDIALSIRNAQSYGINVKSLPNSSTNYSNEFNVPYGVHFQKNISSFTFFADPDFNITNNLDTYSPSKVISTTNITRGSIISDLCAGTELDCVSDISDLKIYFKRPDPVAHIVSLNSFSDATVNEIPYAEITIKAVDGSTRKIIVRSTGQIGVK